MSATVRVGTSGWHYGHWRGRFYPDGMRPDDYLAFYARHFDTVEVNNSFYHLPTAEAFQHWRDEAPPGSLFAVKGSRYITHLKKLKEPETPLANVVGRAQALGDELGPILFQLPPHWRLNLERLRDFLAAVPTGPRYAMEFREPSWFDDRVYQALAKRGVALCLYNMGGQWSPEALTANFVCVRMHGPGHEGPYAEGELAALAESVRAWLDGGHDVYCYFSNDVDGNALRDGRVLKEMLGSGAG